MLALGLAGGVLPAGQRERAPSVAAAAADLPVLHPGRPAARAGTGGRHHRHAAVGRLRGGGRAARAHSRREPALRAVLRRGRILGDSDDGAGVAPPPWKDATLAVAHCYRGLADFADALAGMYSGLRPETGAPAWSAVSRSQRALRAALEAARSRIGEVQGARPRAAPARSSCITCSTGPRTVSSPWSPPPTCSNRTRRAGWDAMPAPTCATPCTATPAYAMPSLAPPMPPTRARRIACANGWNATAPICANFAARARARARAGQRHSGAGPAAVRPVRPAGPVRRRRAAGRRGIQLGRRAARQAWNTLRQNLRLESDALRHALRVGIGATLAVALSRSFAVNHGYWMSLTLVFILQPYFAATWQRTVERVLGSVAGAIGASLLGLLLSTPLSVALAVLPIALGTFAARTVNYALFTFFLTSQFVLVSHIQQPDLHEPELAALRAFNSVLGAVLALLIGFLLWPRRRPRAGRCAGARAAATCRLCAGARSGKERRGGGVAAAHRRAAPAGLPGGRQCPGVTGTAAAEPLAPRQQGRHGGSPAQCHAPGDRRRHRAGNPARAACRQRSGIRCATTAKPWRRRCTRATANRNPAAGSCRCRRRWVWRNPVCRPSGTHRPPGAAGPAAARQAPTGLGACAGRGKLRPA